MLPSNDIPLDRLSPTRRPAGRPVAYHTWTRLLFIHWRLTPELLRGLIPPELSIDCFDGDAWVGLVPFQMSRVRPWWFPPVPGISNFPETNVRTYVYTEDGNPGVWFFSLEAARSLAVHLARRFWNLPYHRATMRVSQDGNSISYRSVRHWPGTSGARCTVSATLGDTWAGRPEPSHAELGTLEHFLIERYLLYTRSSDGRLWRGQVHHRSYALRAARLDHLDETLLKDNGILPLDGPCHVAFSEGVVVEVFPLQPVS